MNIIKKIINNLFDFPNTVLFNFKAFPIKIALKLPVKVHRSVKIGKIPKGSIVINSDKLVSRMVLLGYKGAGFISTAHSTVNILGSGKIIFNRNCVIAEGFNIHCDNGELIFGSDFYANRNMTIQCENRIEFGKDNLVGWNVCVRDTDGHSVSRNNETNYQERNVFFKDHVWIASDCTILKGTNIEKDCVIGCNSLLCGLKVIEQGCLVVGVPAIVKRKGVCWEK
ncbi:hypothetical protein [Enterococcus faecium]|uniref:acyltransferase n=1 Tax=Enterococcus faecium TaxID=1352 RepID=UPI0018844606|nr:hypothetical protein [Enterococcus faecium]EME5381315.1 hypothetical protein [Enterococcus faecium]MBE9871855.1 hypothetical protein [Enterococcus faecium]MDK4437930.1 hypothetical protein [Enterococcus faecium]HBL8370100.1 hypothetical protein [Enterococcus faecium]